MGEYSHYLERSRLNVDQKANSMHDVVSPLVSILRNISIEKYQIISFFKGQSIF